MLWKRPVQLKNATINRLRYHCAQLCFQFDQLLLCAAVPLHILRAAAVGQQWLCHSNRRPCGECPRCRVHCSVQFRGCCCRCTCRQGAPFTVMRLEAPPTHTASSSSCMHACMHAHSYQDSPQVTRDCQLYALGSAHSWSGNGGLLKRREARWGQLHSMAMQIVY